MDLTLGVPEAGVLAQKAAALSQAARELSAFADQDPGLAGDCGVEVNALEARGILSGGVCERLGARCMDGIRNRRPIQISGGDLEQLERLEGVLSVASSRIGLKIAAIDAAGSQEGVAMLGSVMGFATGAVGLIRSVW